MGAESPAKSLNCGVLGRDGMATGELAICDINADGELNVSDVTALINSILD